MTWQEELGDPLTLNFQVQTQEVTMKLALCLGALLGTVHMCRILVYFHNASPTEPHHYTGTLSQIIH